MDLSASQGHGTVVRSIAEGEKWGERPETIVLGGVWREKSSGEASEKKGGIRKKER